MAEKKSEQDTTNEDVKQAEQAVQEAESKSCIKSGSQVREKKAVVNCRIRNLYAPVGSASAIDSVSALKSSLSASPMLLLASKQNSPNNWGFKTLDSFSSRIVSETSSKRRMHKCCYVASASCFVASAGASLSLLSIDTQNPKLPPQATDCLYEMWEEASDLAPVRLAAPDAEVLAKLLQNRLSTPPPESADQQKMYRRMLLEIQAANVHENLVKQLAAKVPQNAGSAFLSTQSDRAVLFVVPRQPFIDFCNYLLLPPSGASPPPESSLPAITHTLEQLHWLRNGMRIIKDGPGQRFHVEFKRLQSFDGVEASEGAEYLNDKLAQSASSLAAAGFYYVGSQSENSTGYCVHFETGASVPTTKCDSFLRLLEDPWAELEILCPRSRFISGQTTENVPLAISLMAMQGTSASLLQDAESEQKTILHLSASSCPLTDFVATGSSDGTIGFWAIGLSQNTVAPARVCSVNALADPKASSVAASIFHAWTCEECSFDNEDPSFHERCEMCDSPNPSFQEEVMDIEGEDPVLESMSSFLRNSPGAARLAAVQVIPLPSSSTTAVVDSAEAGNADAGEKDCEWVDPGLTWAGGWAAPHIAVHIIEGVYSGTDAVVESSGPEQCMIRTAFDSVEFVKASQLKPKAPSKGEKAFMSMSSYFL